MSTTMRELDRQPRRAKVNDRLFLEALHHCLASAADALRQIEQRVEAVRVIGKGSRLRDVVAAVAPPGQRHGQLVDQLVGALTRAENIRA
jgi:hypothetical protein